MFFLTAGFHRYFAHRTFKTSRAFQVVLAVGGTLAAQKGVLWWAANHRIHHRYADQPGDIHSPRQRGFWWSHAGWFLSGVHAHTEWEPDQGLCGLPGAAVVESLLPGSPIGLALLLLALGGVWALVWGFLVSTVLLWHGTFTVNSLAHMMGRRRYQTDDDSRNSLVIALATMGEGWHNNHHRFPGATNQGFFWYELDVTYYLLRIVAWLGLIRDLRRPPPHVLDGSGRKPIPGGPPAHPA
jgi:stearoyl-CoA desaturase (delta-9 desaturase)